MNVSYVSIALALLAIYLLVGCITFGPQPRLMKMADPQTVQMTWMRSLPTDCPEPGVFWGCATRSPGYEKCKIEMPEDASDFVVAEEFRHCFGYEHKPEVR